MTDKKRKRYLFETRDANHDNVSVSQNPIGAVRSNKAKGETSILAHVSNTTKYDVFLNHRGPDVKANFVAHLRDALIANGFNPFLDAKALVKGEDAFQSIDEVLNGVGVHVAVFSCGYAESKWCLNELCDMLKCVEKGNAIILPVFYDVKPLDLRWIEGGPFKEAFEKHEAKGRCKDIERWKKALLDVANIEGYELAMTTCRDESELKNQIVLRISEILCSDRLLVGPQHSVGLANLMYKIIELLGKMGDGVGVLGIVGMGGIGKTTLVKEIYNHYVKNHTFKSHSFIYLGDHVRDTSRSMFNLQKQVIHDLLQVKDQVFNEGNYQQWFKKLASRKVLIVMDDIWDFDDFLCLVPGIEENLGPGSRVIVTSRDRHVTKLAMRVSPQSHLHDMQVLDVIVSRKLFNLHAFRNGKPRDDFHQLAIQVADACKGLPLAIEIIGRHLFEAELNVWEETAESLEVNDDILCRLSISFEGLKSSQERIMFLDICCHMIGLHEDVAMDIWKSCSKSCSLNCQTSRMPQTHLTNLKNKSLVALDGERRLVMHDLLRDMGRMMVGKKTFRDETPEVEEWSHLWKSSDAKCVLVNDEGTRKIRGFSMIRGDATETLNVKGFKRMNELHFVLVDGCNIYGDFSNLFQKVRWLQWRSSNMKEWPCELQLPCLIHLDLSDSSFLTHLWQTLRYQKG